MPKQRVGGPFAVTLAAVQQLLLILQMHIHILNNNKIKVSTIQLHVGWMDYNVKSLICLMKKNNIVIQILSKSEISESILCFN